MAVDRPAPRALVWIIRAEPGASETAARLRALGFEPLVAPLLTVSALPLPEPDLSEVTALAFTSANGVRAFSALVARRDLPVFAVGDATALAAEAQGFQVVGRADAGAAALAAALIADRAWRGVILHPTAREPAGDLVGRLTAAGLRAATLTVYETHAASDLPPASRGALADGAVGAVLIHSPRAARTLATLLQREGVTMAAVDLLGLSAACLAPLAALPFAARLAAPKPAEHAVLALLRPQGFP